jgi:signal transduction histidine kinase
LGGVIEAHGGRMWIEGEPGSSRCVFTLPVAGEGEVDEEAAAE